MEEDDVIESLARDLGDDFMGIGDDEEMLDAVLQAKLKKIRAFADPVLQHQYEDLLRDEEKLLSLDSVIAMSKVRLGVVMKKGKPIEAAQMIRAVVDAVEQAIAVREKQKEYIHLEQMLWVLDAVYEIMNDEISNQEEITNIARRMKRLKLPNRNEVPIDQKRMARALADGRRQEHV